MKPCNLQFKLEFVRLMAGAVQIMREQNNNVIDLLAWGWPQLGLVLNRCGDCGSFGTN